MCKVLAVDDGVVLVQGTRSTFANRPEPLDIPDDIIDSASSPHPALPHPMMESEFLRAYPFAVDVVGLSDAEVAIARQMLGWINCPFARLVRDGESGLERLLRTSASETRSAIREVLVRRGWDVVIEYAEPALLLDASSSGVRAIADEFMHRLDMKSLSQAWSEVSQARAGQLLERLLHMDLAYESELMTHDVARALTARLLAPFREAAYLTNVGANGSWQPVTEATFDGCVIAVGRDVALVVCVQDED